MVGLSQNHRQHNNMVMPENAYPQKKKPFEKHEEVIQKGKGRIEILIPVSKIFRWIKSLGRQTDRKEKNR